MPCKGRKHSKDGGIRALILSLLLIAFALPALALDIPGRQIIILDPDTDTILFERDADQPVPPASMSKLMTIYMVLDALKSGRITEDSKFSVSEKASKMGGSKMFTREGDKIRVIDLLRGIIVQSGNDACVVVAEGLAGSEANFAKRMNEKAQELGLQNSRFANSSGLPDDGHYMSVRDLAILAEHLREDFPEYFPMFKETEFTWEDIRQTNRNPLLYMDIGADGLKTGHTSEAGYCLTATAERDGRRVVVAFTGLDSKKQREEVARQLVDYAFREFVQLTPIKEGQSLVRAAVSEGTSPTILLGAFEGMRLTLPSRDAEKLEARTSFDSPIAAPIRKGDVVGQYQLVAGSQTIGEYPLVALEDVARAGFFARTIDNISIMLGISEFPSPEIID